MGLFRLVHDVIGIDARKLSPSLKNTMRSMKRERDKFRRCDKVKKFRA